MRGSDALHYTMEVRPFPSYPKRHFQRTARPCCSATRLLWRCIAVQSDDAVERPEGRPAERHAAPIVNVALAVDAGYAADPAGRPVRLARPQPARRWNDHADGLPIVDEPRALGARTTGSSLDLLRHPAPRAAGNLAPSLALLADVVLTRVSGICRASRSAGRSRRSAGEGAPAGRLALRVLPGLLYGQAHAYANRSPGPATSRGRRRSAARTWCAWHRTWFHPANSTLIVTGDVTMAELAPALEARRSGAGPAAGGTEERDRHGRPQRREIYLIDKPDALQSAMIVAAHVSEKRRRRGPGDGDGDAQLRRHRHVAL